jgi:molybdenum cofactor cytidylyltransferase
VAAIVVAAGCSRRMGRPKLLLPWRGGRPIIDDVVTRARAATPHVVVVTGHDATAAADAIAHHQDIQLIHNADYAGGEMVSSVKAGVAALPPACAAFFLVLGDQPGIAAGTFARLLDAWQANPAARIISPTWNNRRGHPVLFSAAGVPEILALPADATLKTYVTRHAQRAIEVKVDDPAVCIDVDTPEQYTRLVAEAATATATAGAADGSETGSPSCSTNATTTTVAAAAD